LLSGLGVIDIWGIAYLSVIPRWLFVLTFALALAILWGSRMVRTTTEIKPRQQFSKRMTLIIMTVTSLAIIVLFIVLRSKNHLLGDGYTVLANVADPIVVPPAELLAFLSTRMVYFLTGSAELSFVILSVPAGLVFLTIAYLYARSLSDSAVLRAAVVLVFAGIGQIQFFFGYAENYTWMTVFVSAFIFLGYKYVVEDEFFWFAIVSFVIAGLFHVSAWFLLPGALYLLSLRYRRSRRTLYLLAFVLLVAAAGLLAVLIYTHYKGAEIFVPPWATNLNPYSLFSHWHLIDIGNLALLAAPLPIFIILICLLGIRQFISRSHNEGLFLGLCTVSGSLFTLIIDPKLGASRDWDLLSFFAIPTTFLAAFFLAKLNLKSPMYSRFLAAAIAVLIFHSLPWVVSNTFVIESKDFLKRVIANDPHYSPAYYKGLHLKYWSLLMWADPYFDFEEVSRASDLQLKAYPNDNTNRVTCSYSYYLLGRFDESLEVLHELDYRTLRPESALLALRLYLSFGDPEAARKLVQDGYYRFPENDIFKWHYAVFSALTTGPEEALAFYNYRLDRQQTTLRAITAYAEFALALGHTELAKSVLSKADNVSNMSGREEAEVRSLRKLVEIAER
jgi:tetratricopeptide (TPR) repeat protein